jgi:hypothetical protein
MQPDHLPASRGANLLPSLIAFMSLVLPVLFCLRIARWRTFGNGQHPLFYLITAHESWYGPAALLDAPVQIGCR